MVSKLTPATPVTALTATGVALNAGDELVSIAITATANATVILSAGVEAGGETLLKLACIENDCTVFTPSHPIKLATGAYATIAGAGAVVSIAKI